tara:strand:- start:145 stop:972 length:828 start_codon:yes stop_codon:yes gene_type:complete
MKVDVSPNTGLPSIYDRFTDFEGGNPVVLIIVTLILVLYYLIFGSLADLQVSVPEAENPMARFMEILLWSMFLILLLLNGLRYFFQIDLVASVDNLFSEKPEVNVEVSLPEDDEVPEIKEKPQVFHVSNNKYNFTDAKAICKAYGADLATYDQIEKAYKNGAEWCGYGWSNGQMALFPTQKTTWNNLQKIPGHENDCGRPGINGGYIDNPNVKFGINCFGYKPKINDQEQEIMNNSNIYPKTKADIAFEKKVEYWKRKLPEILISPFNRTNWSRI